MAMTIKTEIKIPKKYLLNSEIRASCLLNVKRQIRSL